VTAESIYEAAALGRIGAEGERVVGCPLRQEPSSEFRCGSLPRLHLTGSLSGQIRRWCDGVAVLDMATPMFGLRTSRERGISAGMPPNARDLCDAATGTGSALALSFAPLDSRRQTPDYRTKWFRNRMVPQ
jgi:hypothetical protein